jgi:feruloyl-CoA synthase
MAWVDRAGAERLFGLSGDPGEIVADERVRRFVADAVARHNGEQTGTGRRVARILLLAEPPAIDANEITDKGYINQRAVLERRAADVERLYAEPPDAAVILPTEAGAAG